jgi:hypothetical protein
VGLIIGRGGENVRQIIKDTRVDALEFAKVPGNKVQVRQTRDARVGGLGREQDGQTPVSHQNQSTLSRVSNLGMLKLVMGRMPSSAARAVRCGCAMLASRASSRPSGLIGPCASSPHHRYNRAWVYLIRT